MAYTATKSGHPASKTATPPNRPQRTATWRPVSATEKRPLARAPDATKHVAVKDARQAARAAPGGALRASLTAPLALRPPGGVGTRNVPVPR